jgi:hypothetical protein
VAVSANYLDGLLFELTKKVEAVHDPKHKVIEMGCFVEVVHRALQQCLLKKPSPSPNETLIDYWDRHSQQFSASLTRNPIIRLSVIYGARNKCAHPPETENDQREQEAAISFAASDFETLKSCVQRIAKELGTWRRSEKCQDFLGCLENQDTRRPHYVWGDRLKLRLLECKRTLNNNKALKKLIKQLVLLASECEVMLDDHDTNEGPKTYFIDSFSSLTNSLLERAEAHDPLLKYKNEMANILEALIQFFEDEDRCQRIKPFIDELRFVETATKADYRYELVTPHLCLRLKYDQGIGLKLLSPFFIPHETLVRDQSNQPKLQKLSHDLQQITYDVITIDEFNSDRVVKRVKKQVAFCAFKAARIIKANDIDLGTNDISLTILVDHDQAEEDLDDDLDEDLDDSFDDYDDDIEDEDSVKTPLFFDYDFHNYRLITKNKRYDSLKVEFANVSTVWLNLAKKDHKRDLIVTNPSLKKRELSVIYRGYSDFADYQNENPNAVFGQVKSNKISESVTMHRPMGAICLVTQDRQKEGDLTVEDICEKLFSDLDQLSIKNFVQELAHLIKRRSFYGQLLLHDPALLKHFSESKQL